MYIALLIIGFFLLIKGADWLVGGARSIALRFGISELIIGLTIVSLGTSMPELIVSLLAAVQGSPGMAIGNVLGSNIANVLLILGLTAVIQPLPVHRNTVLSEIPFSIAAAMLLGFLANASLPWETGEEHLISRSDGGLILFFFLLFAGYVFVTSKDTGVSNDTPTAAAEQQPLWKSALYIAVGVGGLFLGGKWVVDGAKIIGALLGMSETFMGLTIVAVGTSLPELVTSVVAARRGNTDIAVGNIVGSNIFNILWILGICSLVTPLPFDLHSNTDLFVVLASGSMVLGALMLRRQMAIRRPEGVVFLLAYVAYIVYLVTRG